MNVHVGLLTQSCVVTLIHTVTSILPLDKQV